MLSAGSPKGGHSMCHHRPLFWIKQDLPFTYTGVDFAGFLYTRESETKVFITWICLYTCCVTRAIHLEIIPDKTVRIHPKFETVLCTARPSQANCWHHVAKWRSSAVLLWNESQVGVQCREGSMVGRSVWAYGSNDKMLSQEDDGTSKADLWWANYANHTGESFRWLGEHQHTSSQDADSSPYLMPCTVMISVITIRQLTPTLLTRRLTYLNNLIRKFWKCWQSVLSWVEGGLSSWE